MASRARLEKNWDLEEAWDLSAFGPIDYESGEVSHEDIACDGGSNAEISASVRLQVFEAAKGAGNLEFIVDGRMPPVVRSAGDTCAQGYRVRQLVRQLVMGNRRGNFRAWGSELLGCSFLAVASERLRSGSYSTKAYERLVFK